MKYKSDECELVMFFNFHAASMTRWGGTLAVKAKIKMLKGKYQTPAIGGGRRKPSVNGLSRFMPNSA
jgi:hypothetical protein